MSSASIHAVPFLDAEPADPLTEQSDWLPVHAVGTPWQRVLNDQLAGVLRYWFRSKAFSRGNRRAFTKLNLRMRSVAAEVEPLSPQ